VAGLGLHQKFWVGRERPATVKAPDLPNTVRTRQAGGDDAGAQDPGLHLARRRLDVGVGAAHSARTEPDREERSKKAQRQPANAHDTSFGNTAGRLNL